MLKTYDFLIANISNILRFSSYCTSKRYFLQEIYISALEELRMIYQAPYRLKTLRVGYLQIS